MAILTKTNPKFDHTKASESAAPQVAAEVAPQVAAQVAPQVTTQVVTAQTAPVAPAVGQLTNLFSPQGP